MEWNPAFTILVSGPVPGLRNETNSFNTISSGATDVKCSLPVQLHLHSLNQPDFQPAV